MIITDSQVHIWAENTPERPWPIGRPAKVQRPVPFTKEDLIEEMERASVSRAVIVPPSWEGDRNDIGLEAAEAFPERFAVMGRLSLENPESRGLIRSWRTKPGLLGMRLTFRNELELSPLYDPDQYWIWSEAQEADVPIMVYPVGLLDEVAYIAEQFPDLRFVIDHMALHRFKGAEAFVDFPKLLKLARFNNIAVKASALPCFSAEAYPYRDIHGYIRAAYDAYGPKRVFWGTDMTRLPCSYRQGVTLFTQELPWLSDEDKEWIMGRAVSEWLRWPIEGVPGKNSSGSQATVNLSDSGRGMARGL